MLDVGNRIGEYPNHSHKDGVLFIGSEFTKKIVKPDENGIYKIRFQQKDYYHTLEELLSAEKIERREEKPKIILDLPKPKKKPKKVNLLDALCEEYDIKFAGYKNWLYRQNISYSNLAESGHRKMMALYRKGLFTRRESDYQRLCKRYDISYTNYKSRLHFKGFKLSDLSLEEHEEKLKEYRYQLFKEGKL